MTINTGLVYNGRTTKKMGNQKMNEWKLFRGCKITIGIKLANWFRFLDSMVTKPIKRRPEARKTKSQPNELPTGSEPKLK